MNILLRIVSLFKWARAFEEPLWNYTKIEEWGGYCNDGNTPGKPQQSPIDISSDDIHGLVNLSFTDLLAGPLQLTQALTKDPSGQMKMLLESATNKSPLASISFDGIHYHLDHIHSHWGSSEHLIQGRGADGNFHLVFMGEDPAQKWGPLGQAVAVIEVKIAFSPTEGISGMARCPTPSAQDLKDAHTGLGCAFHDHNEAETVRRGPPSPSPSGHILSALGHSDKSLQEASWAHYDGSLTTPPCSGNVKWFVINEPVVVHDPYDDWNGCRAFAHAHPARGDQGQCEAWGNVRPTQLIQEFTRLKGVSVTFGTTPPLGTSRFYMVFDHMQSIRSSISRLRHFFHSYARAYGAPIIQKISSSQMVV